MTEIWKDYPPKGETFIGSLADYRVLGEDKKRTLWKLPPAVKIEWPLDAPQPTDNVNSPPHYVSGGIECFDAMRAMLTDEEIIGYLRGNSFKYRWRFRHKNGAEDLKKAEWYERKLLEIIDVSA